MGGNDYTKEVLKGDCPLTKALALIEEARGGLICAIEIPPLRDGGPPAQA